MAYQSRDSPGGRVVGRETGTVIDQWLEAQHGQVWAQGAAPNGREALGQDRELPTSCVNFLGQQRQMPTHRGSEQQKPVLSQAGDQTSEVRVSQRCTPFRGSS